MIQTKSLQDGWRALHHAVVAQHTDVVAALIAGRVDLNARIKGNGETALHLASRRGFHTIISLLATAGADLELKTPGLGQTSLHLAVFHQHEDAVERLLRHGANVAAIDDESASPFQLALFNGNKEIEIMLKDLGKAANDNFELRELMIATRVDQKRNSSIFSTD